MPSVYLDHAAATPLDAVVATAMQQAAFYNPSALYQAGRESRIQLETARATIARALGAKSSEIIFTAGGSESDNMALHGIMRQFPGKHCIVSAIEHAAVLEPAKHYEYRLAAVRPQGTIDLDALQAMINDDTVLISVMYANNEIGTIQPLSKIGQLVQAERDRRRLEGIDTPLYLHSDACQATNYLNLHVARLGVDLFSLNAGKMYGPKQSGILYVRGGLRLVPLIDGGGQERGLRSGTESAAQNLGLAAALTAAQALRHDESARLAILQRHALRQLQVMIPPAIINGSLKQRLPNNLHITIPGQDNERLIMALDERGIMVAAGSACSASSDEPSHVLRAIGVSQADARASLRLTMGRSTTADELDYVIRCLAQLVA